MFYTFCFHLFSQCEPSSSAAADSGDVKPDATIAIKTDPTEINRNWTLRVQVFSLI